MEWKNRLDIFDLLILVALVAMIVFSPMAMGSVAPWARNSLLVLSLFITALWLMQAAVKGRLRLVREPFYILVGVFFLIALAQLIPLSASTMDTISPGTATLYEKTLGPYTDAQQERTLSVTPYHTERELYRLATFFLVFLVVTNTFRRKSQIITIVLALVAVGSFQAIYGFGEHFSTESRIFWNKKLFNPEAVTGTYINKNHFAGLLEMVIPVALGYFMTVAPRWNRGGNFRSKALQAVSGQGLHRQLILGSLIVIMAVAVLFSLSRAGIICMVGSWIAFLLFIGMTAGFRKYTLALLLLVLIVLCVAGGIGTEMVVERLEEVSSSQAVSWEGRTDLWRSGLTMIGTFPLLGSGLGTFEEAFERFQSPRFGDKYADYLHNDWLQVFCETGIVGGTVAVVAVLLLLSSLLRKTLTRRDSFCRWMAIGSLSACGAMLLHSLFDFNLYKITANGLVFSVVLALWHVAANMAGSSRHSRSRAAIVTIPLEARTLRVLVVVVAVGASLLLAVQPIRRAAADIELNNYLALPEARGRTHYYHFLPPHEDPNDEPVEMVDRALSLDRTNPRMLFHKAEERVRVADGLVKRAAHESALSLLGGEEIAEADRESFRELEQSLFNVLLADMSEVRRPLLDEAARFLHEAIERSPSTKAYHLAMAEISGELGTLPDAFGASPGTWGENDNLSQSMDVFPGSHEAEVAMWLAPRKPGTLFRVGKILLVNAMNRGVALKDRDSSAAAVRSLIMDSFRRSIASDPKYAEKIYPLARNPLGGSRALFELTPDTVSGLERLTEYFWYNRNWKDVLESLERMRTICMAEKRETFEGIAFAAEGSVAFDARTKAEILADLSRWRCEAFGLLGRFGERKTETFNYLSAMREMDSPRIDQARVLLKSGYYRGAMSTVLDVLEKDWSNPEILFLAAELSRIPGAVQNDFHGRDFLDLLFRTVLPNSRLEQPLADHVIEILDEESFQSASEESIAVFIRGAALTLSERQAEAASILDTLAREKSDSWPESHLAWHYLGKTLQDLGRRKEATAAFEQVLEKVPAHDDSIRNLIKLGIEHRGKTDGPEIFADVPFGGIAVFLGYTLEKTDKIDSKAPGSISLFWKILVPANRKLFVTVRYFNVKGELVGEDHFQIYPSGNDSRVHHRCGEIFKTVRNLPDKVERIEEMWTGIHPSNGPHYYSDSGERVLKTSLRGL